MPDVRPVRVAMRSRIHLTSALLALGLACAPQPRETRPASVPANAVLLRSPSAPHRFWASCDPSLHDPRRFVCTFFHETTGAPHSRNQFVLVQGDPSGAPPPPPPPGAVPPAFTPASLPQTLQLRGFDGFLLSAQPPWLLIPTADPPVRGDPPEHGASSSTPRPA